MRVVPGPGTGSEWYRLQTTTPQPRGGIVLLGVGQGQGVLLLQTTTFPEAPRQVNRCALTDYYSGEAELHASRRGNLAGKHTTRVALEEEEEKAGAEEEE